MASCAPGSGGLAGGHGDHIGLGPGVQRHQPQGGGAHGQRRERCQAQHRQHHPARDHVDALRQRATHPRRQLAASRPCGAAAAPGPRRTAPPWPAQCLPHPSARRRPAAASGAGSSPSAAAPWAARPQHPAIGRVHIRRLRLVADKAEHHDGARGQVAYFLAPGHGACHALHQRGHRQIAWRGGACQACCTGSNASMAPVMPSTTARVPSRQAQPAVDGLPAHAFLPLYLSWKVSDWMYCLPACGLPALAVDSGTRTSDGLSRMSSTAASMRIS
jgi:hypothetical protein